MESLLRSEGQRWSIRLDGFNLDQIEKAGLPEFINPIKVDFVNKTYKGASGKKGV
jgi:hypothetical protein